MSNRLYPLRLSAPGFFGLNKQALSSDVGPQWATEATNLVFDEAGRLASRKGFTKLTTSALTGAPSVWTIFEQLTVGSVGTILSAANNKLYSGTTTLTDITGTADDVTGITADHWRFQNLGSSVIGFQAGHDPVYRTTGNFSLLQQQINDWDNGVAYVAGDVVKSTSGNETLYFHCTTSGTSDGSEPSWDTVVGNTTADNTVVWTTRKFPNGNVCTVINGHAWVTSNGDNTVVEISDILIPSKFKGGASASIDLKQVWKQGIDEVVQVAAIEGKAVIFGKKSILVYTGTDDPATMTLSDEIYGTGCIARDTVVSLGTDLAFLSQSGYRSLQRTIQNEKMPLNDISKNVRDYLMDLVDDETPARMKAVYSQREGFLLLNLPQSQRMFCFDTKRVLEDGALRVTYWTGIRPYGMFVSLNETVYLGKEGYVAEYDGYTDNEEDYTLIYRSAWVDLLSNMSNTVSRRKIPKKLVALVSGGSQYTIEFIWSFDYRDNLYSSHSTVPVDVNAAQYNISEYSLAEYSGGLVFSLAEAPMSGSGNVIRFGFNVTMNGQKIAFQEILVLTKLGKIG